MTRQRRPGPQGRGRGRPAGPPRTTKTRRSRGLVVTSAHDAPSLDDGKVRLNRFLATSGLCSRRTADEWIRAGRIEVNGEVVTELGTRVDPLHDDVRAMGSRVQPEKSTYVLFNKPKGVVCTNAPNEQRRRVLDYLGSVRGRLFTVGRLDADSEGLILVTNDGAFAQTVAHPSHGIAKTYAILVRGRVNQETIAKARGGVWLSEGRTGGAQITAERRSRDRTYLKVTIKEGRNREVRRVFARLGHQVISLKRVRIGPLTLHGLGSGDWRFLTRKEVQDVLDDSRGAGGGEWR